MALIGPPLETGVAGLAARGVTRIEILPLFLASGRQRRKGWRASSKRLPDTIRSSCHR
ncbi:MULTISPECIES: CbiX/SirB N-terminal domain-containing protein [Salinicola]|uniref:CbiX/SirB N-terminal domain-containing protein n=1 Tax=Salinicola TaxID=404432 RepID=UPI000B10DB4A|nr:MULTISPECIES: CbiX/SirB N-terminal domain-containing protein [Salinicola]